MPQRPLRLTFGPSRSGLRHEQFAGSGFRGRISEAWPHFSAPGAFTHGSSGAVSGVPQKEHQGINTKRKYKKHNSRKTRTPQKTEQKELEIRRARIRRALRPSKKTRTNI